MSRSTYATAPGALTEQIRLPALGKLIEIAKASGITYLCCLALLRAIRQRRQAM